MSIDTQTAQMCGWVRVCASVCVWVSVYFTFQKEKERREDREQGQPEGAESLEKGVQEKDQWGRREWEEMKSAWRKELH